MVAIHRAMATWKNAVTAYIVFTEFYRRIFIEGGLPAEKLMLKPHFVTERYINIEKQKDGTYALFVGRLDPENGILTLLNAWKNLSIPLKIRGSGPLEERFRNFIEKNNLSNVELVGRLSDSELASLMSGAQFLVVPFEGYYETFGMVVIECFAQGVPVLASGIGVLPELVSDGKTGLHFRLGDSVDLASKAQFLWDNPAETKRMGHEAVNEYEAKYTPEKNYEQLMHIYHKVLSVKSNV